MMIYVYFLTMVMKGICFLKHTSPLMCVTITKRFYSNQRKLGYELFLFFFFSEKGKIIMLVCRVVHC